MGPSFHITGITSGQKCDIRNVYGLLYLDELEGKDDALVAKDHLITLSGKPFESIIWRTPAVTLTKNKVRPKLLKCIILQSQRKSKQKK